MRNILVVEDSPMVLKILEQMFRQQAELQPLFCATLHEAQVLLEASAELFFAAIIDLNLPDAPNGEIVDLVLQYQLPSIVLTGTYDEQRREEMLLKGVVDYVLKENQYSYDYAFRLLHRLERNRSVKILVADDSNATRHFIRNVLSSHLYQIHEAADGEEALRILQEQPDFDLLITDHSMPGISGFELTKVLRQKLKRHDLCILGLSADSKGSLSAQFIKHGADDFLRKPFSREEFFCRVSQNIDQLELIGTLQDLATRDFLTGLPNRRHFLAECHALLPNTLGRQQSVTAAIIDIDHFKHINDTYGHEAGDVALKAVAQAIARHSGTQDLVARFGGEEFCALVPYLGESESVEYFESLRAQIEAAAATETCCSTIMRNRPS